MPNRLSPSAIVALKDALCCIYWYKADLRSFLHNCLRNPSVLASLNWGAYKRQTVSDLVDRLCEDQDQFLEDLMQLCYAVCDMTSFHHLEQLDGGAQKAQRARATVAQLTKMVEPHQEIERERAAIEERQKMYAEKLKASGAVRQKLEGIRARYTNLVVSPNAQGRGFELEKVMYDLFELFDLDPKASFRVVGEQMDGAFSLEGTDYLFEAKWQQKPVGASDLDAFAGKIKRKLDNTLGVFLSINFFSEDGVQAHSSGRGVVLLMDGAGLMAVLERRIDFVSLLIRKKQHAARTGEIYLRIHQILG